MKLALLKQSNPYIKEGIEHKSKPSASLYNKKLKII